MSATVERADVEHFRAVVGQRLGLAFDDGKLEFLSDALRQRMGAAGCGRFSGYVQLLQSIAGAEEMRAIARLLTVNETYFFRNPDHFRAFSELVIPDRMRAQSDRRALRILSAGCASGEEAYTLAILLRERHPELAGWDVSLRGIDINSSVVEKAERGHYSSWSLRETSAELQHKYFRADGRDFVLDERVRTAVSFAEQNLAEDNPKLWRRGAFDVIFCRNVTMYFSHEVMRTVIARMAQSLTPGGFLFLGHAETLRGISHDFHLRHTHDTFYYQLRETYDPYSPVPPEALSRELVPQLDAGAFSASPDTSWFDIIHRASERITDLAQGTTVPDRSVEAASAHPARWDWTTAIELLRQERLSEAMALVRALPPESRADPDAQLLLAVLLTNSGELAEAEKVCQHLLQLDELNAGAHYLMALCQEHSGDLAAAREHDQAALYLDPVFAMPHLHLGLLAKRAGDSDTAARELDHALTLLTREDASRILLFGGGFTREALASFCRAAAGGRS